MHLIIQTCAVFFLLQNTLAVLTEEQLLAVLSDTAPTFFSPIPEHTPQNVNIILPVEENNAPGQPPQSNPIGAQGNTLKDIPASEIARSRDTVARQQVEMPKLPVETQQVTRISRGRNSRRRNRIGRRSRNTSMISPVQPEPTTNNAEINSERVQPARQSGNSNNQGTATAATFENQNQQSSMQPGLSLLMLERMHNRRCPFKIHFSNLPVDFMSQDEFDLQYLLPALRAHFMGRACRTEGMKMYLDWLSYLRERHFTV